MFLECSQKDEKFYFFRTSPEAEKLKDKTDTWGRVLPSAWELSTSSWNWNQQCTRPMAKPLLCIHCIRLIKYTIFPIQDLLGYGSDTRLNVPGRADGNWLYRVTAEQINNINKTEYKELNELFGR